ncbi:MAG: thioredoxin [Holdemanella sp.]|nr:thioredoxin [Holdemanella sp.]
MEVINKERFNELMSQDVPVLVDFFATWCGPCKMLAPVLEAAQEALEGKIKIVKVDVDQSMDLASEYGIMAVPTMILFKNGKQVNAFSGYMPEAQLIDVLQRSL